MESRDFSCSISVAVGARDVINKINTVSEWWGVTLSGTAHNLNDTFIVRMSGDSYFNLTVSELIHGKRLVWSVTDCHMPWYSDKKEWTNTKLVFDLNEHDGITEVKFTHEGLTQDIECYKDCSTGWTHWIVASLASYLSAGKGIFRPPTR